ncbi:hypothetical protein SYJ56_18860 [Algoriphagus sp. D3-2-R+10]|uniref:hypothetical protein n=1 Tax=Algoriphagus aurantiacus TaxID=3103948 RepID=UPI002B3A74E0|nr:hypothetical protein [Algoriphagus sp. D3-2-R+10]MEB2777382.1 hypothetical protein [Algoriphagus sp. D3-2-R+10]
MKSLIITLIPCFVFLFGFHSFAQTTSPYGFTKIGEIRPRNADEIEASNWLLGCETMDRDFADYDTYKEYLNPLGIKRLRLQGRWAKTEKVKGQYNWEWLDHIVNDVTSRGLEPWIQFSYGNEIYEGGGGINLAAGVPHSEDVLAAWDRWVAAMVIRYKDKVINWEIWNEPNFGDNLENTVGIAAASNIRTIKIVKRIQPDAKASGLALGHIDLEYAGIFFKVVHESGMLGVMDNITYNNYIYSHYSNYPKVMEMKKILEQYSTKITLRQGENGDPSFGGTGRGAIGDHDWTELSQAKLDTRRMLGDLGHGIESSVFSIIDMAYNSGPIKRLNVKGLLMSDSTKKVIRPKMAYYAVQNITAVFDNSLELVIDAKDSLNSKYISEDAVKVVFNHSPDRNFAAYGYKHRQTGQQVFTIWENKSVPNNSTEKRLSTLTFGNAKFDKPVYVDMITGEVFDIPATNGLKKASSLSSVTYLSMMGLF